MNTYDATKFLDGPFLDSIQVDLPPEATNYPFSIPFIQNLKRLKFPTQVTFFIGENGTGKSTLLEALAYEAGFGLEGGSKNMQFTTAAEKHYSAAASFAKCLTLSWRTKPTNGYFFRAESFFNAASYLDTLPEMLQHYGGTSLHEQSHGESFLSFFRHRLGSSGFFIFDEPEAALSPQRQLSLMRIIYDVCKNPQSQFIIATHSPLLLAYPDATIYSCDSEALSEISYQDTEHYSLTKSFLNDPDRYLRKLFEE